MAPSFFNGLISSQQKEEVLFIVCHNAPPPIVIMLNGEIKRMKSEYDYPAFPCGNADSIP
jgi:hypothetical protein